MERWYSQIELADGTFTDGRPRPSLALCRKFFPRIDKAGLRCLDIGTQDFVAPVLFHRQGAAEIVAYDRLNLESRRAVIAQTYGAKFHYAAGLPLSDLKRHLRAQDISPVFDYVNFCGVLYHMVDPLGGLATARSFLRRGGLMLLETSVSFEPGFIAQVNHAGRLYPGSNYFQVSLETLDYWVRMLRLRIVDAAFTGGRSRVGRAVAAAVGLVTHRPRPERNIGRVVAVCQAVDKPVAEKGDAWMRRQWIPQDMEPFGLDFGELDSQAPPVAYRDGSSNHVMRAGIDSVDLYRSYQRQGPTQVDDSLAALRLKDVA